MKVRLQLNASVLYGIGRVRRSFYGLWVRKAQNVLHLLRYVAIFISLSKSPVLNSGRSTRSFLSLSSCFTALLFIHCNRMIRKEEQGKRMRGKRVVLRREFRLQLNEEEGFRKSHTR